MALDDARRKVAAEQAERALLRDTLFGPNHLKVPGKRVEDSLRQRLSGRALLAEPDDSGILEKTRAPALCVGAVTRNAVDAVIEVAYETSLPIMLIASRRQVDRNPFRGYVEGWSTRDFALYVRSRDPLQRVSLCRDHGGPWQHPAEIQAHLDDASALDAAFASFKEDIDAGFRLLHLDTGSDLEGAAPIERALERLLDLYIRCARYAFGSGQRVEFEIGFEDQRASFHDPVDFQALLAHVLGEIDRRGLPRPRYVVAQTGTKVVETHNEGEVMDAVQPKGRALALRRLRALADICQERNVELKAHNCDYLEPEGWRVLAEAGVGAVNVAPEYGVVQTRTLISLLEHAGLTAARESFLRLAENSGMWRKWLAPRSTAGPRERGIIAGHYVFSTSEARHLWVALARRMSIKPESVDTCLREAVKSAIYEHLDHLQALG